MHREKIKAGRFPFLSSEFSVDNLSWSLRSGELCSGAPSQDPGSRPPLGHRRGAGAGARPACCVTRRAGVPSNNRRRASRGDSGRRSQAPPSTTQVPGDQPCAACITPCQTPLGNCEGAPPGTFRGTLFPSPSTQQVKNRLTVPQSRGAGWTRDWISVDVDYELGQPRREEHRAGARRVGLGRGFLIGSRRLQVVG